MKKCISILVLFVLITTGAFAQMSTGVGFLFDYNSGGGLNLDDDGLTIKTSYPLTSYGFYVFFDAEYVVLDVSYSTGAMDMKIDVVGITFSDEFGQASQLGIGIYGKYPINLGGITVFPMIGIDYNLVSSFKISGGGTAANPGDLSQLGILFGGGLDFDISDTLFLRFDALFQIRFPSTFHRDFVDLLNTIEPGSAETTIGLGPRIRLAIGTRF